MLKNPIELLKKVKTWLKPNGLILAAVPNSNSIHRQAAVLMGLLKEQNELGETDKLIGHRRVYNNEQLKSDFDKSKLSTI
ncbi:methyltransferase domain-containing protein [Paraclostridium bifermentans]|nr:methyltransferase domain-containing protein [Paraclostridium bifermentans]